MEITNRTPIANWSKDLKPIANRNPIGSKSKEVDALLQDYSDLIDPSYIKWFAKKFLTMDKSVVIRSASEAKSDTNGNPARLFAFLIKKRSVNG